MGFSQPIMATNQHEDIRSTLLEEVVLASRAVAKEL
jgi:hypothetical protein